MKKIPMLERFAAQSLVEYDGELIFSKEKFAELIVRECVKFCEHESNDDEHDEYDMGMWVKAESIKTAIMEEFGIKE
jgi:hypothetical protein